MGFIERFGRFSVVEIEVSFARDTAGNRHFGRIGDLHIDEGDAFARRAETVNRAGVHFFGSVRPDVKLVKSFTAACVARVIDVRTVIHHIDDRHLCHKSGGCGGSRRIVGIYGFIFLIVDVEFSADKGEHLTEPDLRARGLVREIVNINGAEILISDGRVRAIVQLAVQDEEGAVIDVVLAHLHGVGIEIERSLRNAADTVRRHAVIDKINIVAVKCECVDAVFRDAHRIRAALHIELIEIVIHQHILAVIHITVVEPEVGAGVRDHLEVSFGHRIVLVDCTAVTVVDVIDLAAVFLRLGVTHDISVIHGDKVRHDVGCGIVREVVAHEVLVRVAVIIELCAVTREGVDLLVDNLHTRKVSGRAGQNLVHALAEDGGGKKVGVDIIECIANDGQIFPCVACQLCDLGRGEVDPMEGVSLCGRTDVQVKGASVIE